MVNDLAADGRGPGARPGAAAAAYHQSASTMNLLRAFTKGGFADLTRSTCGTRSSWRRAEGQRYERIAPASTGRCGSWPPAGSTWPPSAGIHEVDFWTSHEALILGYEEALTRRDSLTGHWYDCSAHLLWVGDRTRQLDGAHLEFLAGVGNPLGVKIGPSVTPDEAVSLCELLNPARMPGRLSLITRLGAAGWRSCCRRWYGRARRGIRSLGLRPDARQHLPDARRAQDPPLRRILAELDVVFRVHRAAGTWPGGVHVELTGEDVTECLGRPERSSTPSSTATTSRCATPGSTPARASTWPTGSRSSSGDRPPCEG